MFVQVEANKNSDCSSTIINNSSTTDRYTAVRKPASASVVLHLKTASSPHARRTNNNSTYISFDRWERFFCCLGVKQQRSSPCETALFNKFHNLLVVPKQCLLCLFPVVVFFLFFTGAVGYPCTDRTSGVSDGWGEEVSREVSRSHARRRRCWSCCPATVLCAFASRDYQNMVK